MISSFLQFEPAFVGYVGSFVVASLACFAGIARARAIEKPDVQRGLVWLLGTTGVWSLFKIGYFVLPVPFKTPAYTIGLVFGFATVFAWLYFCSAYTGRSYHRNRPARILGVGIFLGTVLVKLTNPLHGLYFTVTPATTPFAHLAIEHGAFHWTVTGLSYALSMIGLFMLFELFYESGYDTRPLGVLTGFLGIPIAVDLAAYLDPSFVSIIYAPLGVAVFVLGVLFVFERRFLAVQESEDTDDVAIFLDGEGRIRDWTPAAEDLFPDLSGSTGDPLATPLPRVAEFLETVREGVFERRVDGEQRYFLTSSSTVTLGDRDGSVVFMTDVTTAETRRRELLRHNEQLEDFASAMAHELRNMLQIIEWRLSTARERMEEETVERESVDTAADATQRMAGLVDDFTTLARYGQTIEHLDSVDFRPAVRDAWRHADLDGLDLEIVGEGTVEADSGRLRELLVNALAFAWHNGADTVTVELRAEELVVTGDGQPPTHDPERYLAFGESVPDAESGMKLPNVKAFARVHGWTVDIDTEYTDGVRVVVTGVEAQITPESGDVEVSGTVGAEP